ncbi:enoyl-CoA hydratase/isomerase family protein [Szabonella alba]|uniref:Enoyl-CoA hydratase/isomerase family protein n=1 Tax=Szabonella alba TaxID=2804194 RepID=A0A8K0VF53_9RHOB|nr:enoyl-CoA hydratase/isomerase family protein [Szabonella alba]MBL4919123.1 enoyl-CoA hydratase/isomerase family protein [Szabonella alba]
MPGNSNPALLAERRGEALWLVLNRPAALNPIGMAMVRALEDALDALPQTPGQRPAALVITGAGRAFSAGGDLSEMRAADGDFTSGAPLFREISRVLGRLAGLDLPVIAAVNGICVAGGLEIALACDLVVAEETARFGDAHANFGLLPGGGGSVRLPRAVGASRAKEMMMTGAVYDAVTMQQWGLVNRITPAGGLQAGVAALVAELARKSPLGLKRMKSMVDGGLDLALDAALARELDICEAHDASFDRNEGLAAFTQKRPPRFTGT